MFEIEKKGYMAIECFHLVQKQIPCQLKDQGNKRGASGEWNKLE